MPRKIQYHAKRLTICMQLSEALIQALDVIAYREQKSRVEIIDRILSAHADVQAVLKQDAPKQKEQP